MKFPLCAQDTIFERLSGGWGLCSGLDADAILITGKHPQRAHARNLACYWAVRELGVTAIAFERLLGITQPAVTKAAGRGACRRSEVEIDFI